MRAIYKSDKNFRLEVCSVLSILGGSTEDNSPVCSIDSPQITNDRYILYAAKRLTKVSVRLWRKDSATETGVNQSINPGAVERSESGPQRVQSLPSTRWRASCGPPCGLRFTLPRPIFSTPTEGPCGMCVFYLCFCSCYVVETRECSRPCLGRSPFPLAGGNVELGDRFGRGFVKYSSSSLSAISLSVGAKSMQSIRFFPRDGCSLPFPDSCPLLGSRTTSMSLRMMSNMSLTNADDVGDFFSESTSCVDVSYPFPSILRWHAVSYLHDSGVDFKLGFGLSLSPNLD